MSAKVYVGNLSLNTTDDKLRQGFTNCGQVLDVMIMRDRETRRSKGFGYVTFSNHSEAEAAVLEMNEKELNGHKLIVQISVSNGGSGGVNRVGGAAGSYIGAGTYVGAGVYGGGSGGIIDGGGG